MAGSHCAELPQAIYAVFEFDPLAEGFDIETEFIARRGGGKRPTAAVPLTEMVSMVGPWGPRLPVCQAGADLHRSVPGAFGVGRGSVRLAEPGAEAGQVGELPAEAEEVEPVGTDTTPGECEVALVRTSHPQITLRRRHPGGVPIDEDRPVRVIMMLLALGSPCVITQSRRSAAMLTASRS